MSTQIPNKIEKFKEVEKDFGTSIAEALWKKAAQTLEYINASYPIGMLMFFHETQDNLPATPDSKYWQEVDGSTISNVNSPLNGVTLPDWRGKFFRHPASGEIVLSTGGSNTVNLSHNHGGITGIGDPRFRFQLDNGGERAMPQAHAHGINSDLSSTTSTVPQYRALKVYMRIV